MPLTCPATRQFRFRFLPLSLPGTSRGTSIPDKLGVAFSPAKSDVSGNIERLAKKAPEHAALFDIALEEVKAGTQASNSGCCKGLLWLKRFLVWIGGIKVSLIRIYSRVAHSLPSTLRRTRV